VSASDATGYRHVACCVDRSDAAARALREAARVAAMGGGRLSVVHVVESPAAFTGGRSIWSPREEVVAADLREEAAAWVRDMSAGHGQSEVVVLEGDDPAGAVLGWAEREGCDLLVAAPRRGGLARVVLGSFASQLLRDATCPVLLVPEDAPG
jgi:nucleotide-binding universal stress UspA family protein